MKVYIFYKIHLSFFGILWNFLVLPSKTCQISERISKNLTHLVEIVNDENYAFEFYRKIYIIFPKNSKIILKKNFFSHRKLLQDPHILCQRTLLANWSKILLGSKTCYFFFNFSKKNPISQKKNSKYLILGSFIHNIEIYHWIIIYMFVPVSFKQSPQWTTVATLIRFRFAHPKNCLTFDHLCLLPYFPPIHFSPKFKHYNKVRHRVTIVFSTVLFSSCSRKAYVGPIA